MIVVEIADNQEALEINQTWHTELVRFVLDAESLRSAYVSLAFVDNQTIHRINREFLNHDFATDVITFPLSDPRYPFAGELVVSTEYALKRAPEYGWSATMEAGLYVVHGLLHLCGYDDHADADADAMRQRQELLMRDFSQRRPSSAREVCARAPD